MTALPQPEPQCEPDSPGDRDDGPTHEDAVALGSFRPFAPRLTDVVHPRRVDPAGVVGPTRRMARGPHFERVGPGLFVPADRPRHVYQRIAEAAGRLAPDGSRGSVTGWAALCWHGAAYFDGTWPAGDEQPVEMVAAATTGLRADSRSFMRTGFMNPRASITLDGVPIAPVQRALFDEIRTRESLWGAVQAIDMTAAAGLISVWHFADYLEHCHARRHAPLAREACSLAIDESLSPRESWLRLVWTREAHLPQPLANVPVFDRSGRLVGIPDLLDVETGVAGEYDGGSHLAPGRRRKDAERAHAFRDVGIDPVVVRAGESGAHVAQRLRAAVDRAQNHPPERAWTVEPPTWFQVPEALQDRIDRIGLAASLTRMC